MSKDLWRGLITHVITKYEAYGGSFNKTTMQQLVDELAKGDYTLLHTPHDEGKVFFEDIMSHLNSKMPGKPFPVRYKSSTSALVISLKNHGYTADDIKATIDKKFNQWFGTKMQVNIRPKTLFNLTNFENYIAELEYDPKQHEQTGFQKLISSGHNAIQSAATGNGQ